MKRSPVYTTQEAADYLRVSYGTVCAEIRAGRLVARRIGKSYRIHAHALEDYLLCPAHESQPDSTSAPIRASGSSVTAAKTPAQDIAAQAAARLLKKPSRVTSQAA